MDDLLDSRTAIGSSGYGSMDWLTAETQDVLKPVYQAYRAANGNNINWSQFNFSDLLPFAATTAERAAVQKVIEQKAIAN